MMHKDKLQISLDQQLTYQIRSSGEPGAILSRLAEDVMASIEFKHDVYPVTVLTGIFDQAGLHGLMRRLYSIGVPLISVSNCRMR